MMRPLQYGPVVWRRVRAVRRSRHSHSHSSRRQTLRLRVDSRPLSTSTSAAGTASGASEDEEDPNFPLRRDIKYLGWALGDAIRHTPAHGQEAYASVEQLRGLAKAWRSSSSDKGPAGAPAGPQARAQLQALVDVAASMPSPMLAVVARAFSHFLALSNTAEAYHRIRRRRLRELRLGTLASRDDYAAVPAQPLNTTLGTVQSLLAAHHSAQGTGDSRAAGAAGAGAGAASPEQIYEALCTQCVEIVLTAHPTEVTRRTIVQRHRDIERALGALDHEETLSWHDRRREEAQLLRQVETLWWTDEVRREKPTPLKEARHGLEIVATSMWKAVPAYLRKLDAELLVTPGIERALPPEVVPVRFASWMGGDRDGNPNVTPEVTKQVVIMSRLRGAALVKEALIQLRQDISVSDQKATPELLALLPRAQGPEGTVMMVGGGGGEQEQLTHFRGRLVDKTSLAHQPYGLLFDHLLERTDATLAMLEQGQLSPPSAPRAAAAAAALSSPMSPAAAAAGGAPPPLLESQELIDILMVAYESLRSSGLGSVADGTLRDLIRQLRCFGLALLPLDCRNESVRHSEALDAITRYLGVGSYLEWDEETRLIWLLKELAEKRPLLPRWASGGSYAELGSMFEPTVCDTLGTFDAIAEIPPESLGAYVISMSQSASDVLAVRLLQAEAGVARPMRVVPLFETLDDLSNAPGIMESLWNTSWYKGDIDGKQEVMLGYSDSAKDAGRLAAAWAQYQTQEQLVTAANKHGISLSLFHGKGGTVSRGGDPSTFRAICAQPPGTVNGNFRITEQGEIITQNYAHPAIAESHLNTYTAALLYEQFLPTEAREPSPQHRQLMEQLSERSCADYRAVVRQEPAFIPYFRSATPEIEIASLNVGSRPSKRRPSGGVETLRAIPWVFAWTQTRLNLTAWLGVGSALSALDQPQRDVLQDAYETWPWFTALVDVVDMVLAKTEPDIARLYDMQLVQAAQQEHPDVAEMVQLGKKLRQGLELTRQELLALRGYTHCQQHNDILQRGLRVRSPYVDPLNVLQVETLQRLRQGRFESETEQQQLQDALVITINGIANGQKNSG